MKEIILKNRKHYIIECSVCRKEMCIRQDYIKKHTGKCMSCQKIGNKMAKKHGDSKNRLYRIWVGMHNRNYNNKVYICDDWNKYENFKLWSIKNGYNDNLTIDRIDNNGNYNPKNCQWITLQENAGKDKILFNDIQAKSIYDEWMNGKITQRQLADKYKCSRNTIQRIHKKLKKTYGNT